jgi:hypothetical protein
MTARRSGLTGSFLVALALGLAPGCSVLNPSLVGTWLGNPVKNLERPDSVILILIMNMTAQPAVVRVEVLKTDGSTIELSAPLEPFGSGANLDYSVLAQECEDVASIQLLGGSIQSDSGGETVEIPADLPPITELSCGRVVVIAIQGVGLAPSVTVY